MQNDVESLANADALVSQSFTPESCANCPKLFCRNEQFGLIPCEGIEVDRIMLPKAVSHPTPEGPSHICSNITFITLSSKSRSLSANDIWRPQVWISSHAAHPSPCLAKNSLRALHDCWPKARLFNPHVASAGKRSHPKGQKLAKAAAGAASLPSPLSPHQPMWSWMLHQGIQLPL